MIDPLVAFIVTIFVLSVAAGGWVLGTIRQMKIRKEEVEDAAKTLKTCSDGFEFLGRRWVIEASKLAEATRIIKAVKGTKDAYKGLTLEFKTRINLFLK